MTNNTSVWVKEVIGNDKYNQLVTDITKDIKESKIKDVSSDETLDVVETFCFILFSISFSKNIETTTFKFNLKNGVLVIDAKTLVNKYRAYIKIIEDARFNKIKKII